MSNEGKVHRESTNDYEHLNNEQLHHLSLTLKEHLPSGSGAHINRRPTAPNNTPSSPPTLPYSRMEADDKHRQSSGVAGQPYTQLIITADGAVTDQEPALCNGYEETSDMRAPYFIYPLPAVMRYARSPCPPGPDDVLHYKQTDPPTMYSSYPMPTVAVSKRASRKQKQLRDIYTNIQDEDANGEVFTSNVDTDDATTLMGREVRLDKKKKRRAQCAPPRKVLQDASHSCHIEVDDYGCLLNVTLTDDLAGTDLRFGRQEILFQPTAETQDAVKTISPAVKKKPRPYKVGMRYYAPTGHFFDKIESGTVTVATRKPKRYRLKNREHKGGLINIPQLYEITSKHELFPMDDVLLDTLSPNPVNWPSSGVADQFNVIPEEFTYMVPLGARPQGLDRLAYPIPDSSSDSSEDEADARYVSKQVTDAGVLTDVQWKLMLEAMDSRRRATIRGATLKEMEEIRGRDHRGVSYSGGHPEYSRRHESLQRRSVIPDMTPYAAPSAKETQAARKRFSPAYQNVEII